MLSEIRPAIVSTVLFTLLLGLAYPLAVTARGYPRPSASVNTSVDTRAGRISESMGDLRPGAGR